MKSTGARRAHRLGARVAVMSSETRVMVSMLAVSRCISSSMFSTLLFMSRMVSVALMNLL
jgi:hypothetical protein